MMTYSSTENKKLIGQYEIALISYFEAYGTTKGNVSIIDELYTRRPTDQASVAMTESGSLTDMKPFNGTRTYVDEKEKYTRTYEWVEYTNGMQFDRKFMDDNKIMDIRDRADKLMASYNRTCENMAGKMWTNVDQTSFTKDGKTYTWTLGADGVPIVYDSHTSLATCTTLDNKETLTLDADNLTTAWEKMIDFNDDDDNSCDFAPTILLVTQSNLEMAINLTSAEKEVGTFNNNMNIYNGSLRVIYWNKFRKQSGKTGSPWILMDGNALKENSFWFDRIAPEYSVDSDYDTMVLKCSIYSRFGAGFRNFRFCVGSIPA